MPATPADIAKYTTDGVLVTSPSNPATSAAIKAAHPNAQDLGTSEIEMFYDTEADTQAMLDETFTLLSQVNPPYMALEISEALRLGSAIPIAPVVPSIEVVDRPEALDLSMRVRAFSHLLGTDRYAVELIK